MTTHPRTTPSAAQIVSLPSRREITTAPSQSVPTRAHQPSHVSVLDYYYEDQGRHNARPARLATVQMKRAENGILLGLFLQHSIASMSKADQENCKLFDQIAEEMKETDRVRAVIKSKIIGRHVKN